MRRSRTATRRERRETLRSRDDLLALAAASLGLTEAQEGLEDSTDILHARYLELLVLLLGNEPKECVAARAELVQRRGAGFIERVRAMGTPAIDALSDRPVSYANYDSYDRPWTRSRKSFATSARRSSSRRNLATGCARGRVSSGANRSKSSCAGAGGAFAKRTARRTTRTSRSSAPTGPSSARVGVSNNPGGVKWTTRGTKPSSSGASQTRRR